MSTNSDELIERVIHHSCEREFRWQDRYFCKYCGSKGYYELSDYNEASFCPECEGGEFPMSELYDEGTIKHLLLKTPVVLDKTEWDDVVKKTASQWELNDYLSKKIEEAEKNLIKNLHNYIYGG